MATYKSRADIEKAENKRLTRNNLKKIKKLMSKVENLFNELPNTVQHNIWNVHNEDCSLNHCIRWGVQASDELLEKKTFKKITEDL